MATRVKPFDVDGLMKTAPAPAANLPGWGLSTAIPLPAIAESLPMALQDLARVFIGARERSGAAYLEAAAALAEARTTAHHGEWHTFLATIEMSQDKAERMLNVHDLAATDASFARAVRNDFISRSTAALLAQPGTPPEVIEAVIINPSPPTHRQVTTAIKEAKSATLRNTNGHAPPPTPADVAAMRDRVEALGATFDGTPNARGQYRAIFADHDLLGTIAELRPNISAREQAAAAEAVVTPIAIADARSEPIDDRAPLYRKRLRDAFRDDDEHAEGIAALALGCHLLGLRCELLSEVLDDETYGILAEVMG